MRLSLGRTGSCHDNAVAESWFAMLKNEMYHRYQFATRAAARLRVIRLHRSVLQQPAAPLHPGLPDPGPDARRPPDSDRDRGLIHTEAVYET